MGNGSSGRKKNKTQVYSVDFSNPKSNYMTSMKLISEMNEFWADKKNRETKDSNINDYSKVSEVKIKTYMDVVRIIAPYSVSKLNNLRSHMYKNNVSFSTPKDKHENIEGLSVSLFRGIALYKQKMTSGVMYNQYNFDDPIFKLFLK